MRQSVLRGIEEVLLPVRSKQRDSSRVLPKRAGPAKAEPTSFFFRLKLAQDGNLPYALLHPGSINPYLNKIHVDSVSQILSRETIGMPVKLTA